MNVEEIRRMHDMIHADFGDSFEATIDVPFKLTKGKRYDVDGMQFGHATITDDSGKRMRLEKEYAWILTKT